MSLPRTPCYSYDKSLLERTLDCAKKASGVINDASIHYAIKANSNPGILKIIAAKGLGADCVSGGEIKRALEAGFRPQDIVYSGVGKTDEEIFLALEEGVGCLNAESVEEIRVIEQIASARGLKARVSIRINPDVKAHTHRNITTGKAENKFGINEEKVGEAMDAIESATSLEFAGIHFHIGSQILDMGDFAALCVKINRWQEWFAVRGTRLPSINVGGGLGVDYENPAAHPVPDFEDYFNTFAKGLKLLPGQKFHCELGRSIVAQCGSLIARCTLVKEGTNKKFVILDAGMNDLIRPALYEARHHIDNLSAGAEKEEVYDVVGPICESSDSFASDVVLPETHRGDILAIRSAGAYGESMASTYNSRPLPGSEII